MTIEKGFVANAARRERGDMIQVWKILQGQVDVDPSILFTMANVNTSQRTRYTSYHLNVIKPRHNSNVRKNFFTVRVCDGWNDLPQSVGESSSLNSFNNNYDNWTAATKQ